jgi:hypothetical protein
LKINNFSDFLEGGIKIWGIIPHLCTCNSRRKKSSSGGSVYAGEKEG